MLVGKRMENGTPAANNLPFVILGAALLWFGWFGFNAGSALPQGRSLQVLRSDQHRAAAAALTWVALSWADKGKPSAMAAAIGAVCGLVAITPASGYVGPIASIAIGILGGGCDILAVYLRGRKIAIDDTLDVWAGHGMEVLRAQFLLASCRKSSECSRNNGLSLCNPHPARRTDPCCPLQSVFYSFAATWVILKCL